MFFFFYYLESLSIHPLDPGLQRGLSVVRDLRFLLSCALALKSAGYHINSLVHSCWKMSIEPYIEQYCRDENQIDFLVMDAVHSLILECLGAPAHVRN